MDIATAKREQCVRAEIQKPDSAKLGRGSIKMVKAQETLVEAIERVREGRKLVEDEYGYLRMKKDLTYWEGVRLFFRKWGSFISIVISFIALAVSILK